MMCKERLISPLFLALTGWIGSHVAHEALAAGLCIRLAIRDAGKAKVVVDALEAIHGKGRIETVLVADYAQDGAYDEAVKGVQGVVHAACNLSFSPSPDEVITPALKALDSMLEAACGQTSIRRVVVTSSAGAVALSQVGGDAVNHITPDLWNDEAVEQSKASPNGANVYCACKVLTERAAWEFVEKRKPSFVLNAIHPTATYGGSVPGTPISGSATWVTDAALGCSTMIYDIGPQFHVDVDDVARLHVLCLTREDVRGERILAFGTPYTPNDMIDAIQTIKPDVRLPAKRDEWGVKITTTADVRRANDLLHAQGGLRDLEHSLRRNLAGI